MKERRRCQRIQQTHQLRARIHSGEIACVRDLSPHGALVETESPLRPGSVCDVALTLGAAGVHLRSFIRRCRAMPTDSGEGLVYRAGLEFITPTREQQEPLDDLVAQLCLLPDCAVA